MGFDCLLLCDRPVNDYGNLDYYLRSTTNLIIIEVSQDKFFA